MSAVKCAKRKRIKCRPRRERRGKREGGQGKEERGRREGGKEDKGGKKGEEEKRKGRGTGEAKEGRKKEEERAHNRDRSTQPQPKTPQPNPSPNRQQEGKMACTVIATRGDYEREDYFSLSKLTGKNVQ